MKCPRCQQENPAQAKFCLECGARVALTCTKCRSELPASAKFCLECGEPVGSQVTAEARFTSPEFYTPKHLAEKILTSKSALEGERKQVTVLFADLKGSMELLADRDPEEARNILDPVLERMMEAVHRYEGTVNQVMGDGIMALFGAPLAHEDHAVRACYAALRMQELVKRYAEDARHAHGVNVQIRVGLNSGEVVVLAVGSDLRMDYTAVGQTTHLAARMEQFASPGSVLLTASTLELVEGYVAVKPLGPVPVKGLVEHVDVYEVTGTGPARTRLQASARRGLTRFVGRDAEVEQLRRAQQLAADGHGQLAAVVGEAGVGKSRLLYEFTRSHRLHGWLILEAASVSYGKATSYLPVIDLLKSYFKIQDRDDLRDIREKLTGKVLTLDRALEPALPALLALLEAEADDASWQTLDPVQRRQRTLDAVKRLLLREAREQPLLLIFEDLHWIDGETQTLLDSLVESLGSTRVLVLVNYRPEYQHAWSGKTYYSQMRLDALAVESAGELLDALLGDDPGLVPLKQLLGKRGNPFFLEESVRTLVETKALVGERGRYRLTQPVQTIQVPATVQAVLAARIDRLAPDDKRLLQVASVVGKDVPSALLHAIADLPDDTLRVGLDRLQGAEFLYETSLFPEVEYTFKHALTHEVTYQSLLHERRRALHARIVQAIEGLYRDRLAEQVERLAHHALHGEVWDKALAYLRQAGAKAFARSANREAVAYFEEALKVLQHLPERPERLEDGIDLRIELRNALNSLGDFPGMLDVLREAEVLAERLGDQPRLGRVSAFLTVSLLRTGADRAAESAQRALAIGVALGDFGLQVMARYYLSIACHQLGDYARAIEFLRTNVDLLKGELSRESFGMPGIAAVSTRARMILSLAEMGQFPEATQLADEALRMADAANEVFSQTLTYSAVGELHLARGQFSSALSVLERSLVLCETVPLFSQWTSACLGHARALTGHIAEALDILEQVVSRDRSQRGSQPLQLLALDAARGLGIGRLAAGYLLAGRLDEASHWAHQALARSRESRMRGTEAWTLQLLAEIASHRDPPDLSSAEHYYHQGLTLAGELRMRPLVAHCHLGLGKLYRRTGNHEQAREHLATATTMCREMDMVYWLEKAEAEIRDLA